MTGNNLINRLILFFVVVLSITFLCRYVFADTLTTDSCSYDDVSAKITLATSNDTVIVRAGSCTWDNTLTITKGIILSGVGATITFNTGDNYTIIWQPSDPSLNETFRITGFTFNCDNEIYNFWFRNTSSSDALTNFRFDNNTVNNAGAPTIVISGPIFGVIDNNTFTGSPHIDNYGQNSCNDWAGTAPAFNFGSALNLFIEDNTFTTDYTATTGGHGGRYVFRYNKYIYPSGTLSPWFDMHGNQPATIVAPRGGEIYGNLLDATGSSGIKAFDHRGGQMLIFSNKITGQNSTTAYVYEEYDDNLVCGGVYAMYPTNSYYWSNFDGNSEIAFEQSRNCCDTDGYHNPCNDECSVEDEGYALVENEDWWDYNASFDGTTGVGCGTLASRPATCTTGVGYWATSQNNCTNLTGYVGDSTQRTSGVNTYLQGTLYKCTDTNTWTAYYTPYAYPHPLRGADTTAPADPTYAINAAGSSFTVTFSEAVTHGAGGTTGWVLTSDGGAVTATYSSGEGSTSLVYHLSRTVYSTETVTGTYTQPGNGIEDTAGNDFATVTDVAITNNSTATSGAPTYPKMTLSTGSNVTLSPSGTGSFTLAP